MNEVNQELLGIGSLADHLGCGIDPQVPLSGRSELSLSLLPFRAYQLIWNEWYRDQDIEPKVQFGIEDNQDPSLNDETFTLRRRSWEKDYFTAARPWPIKGGDDTEARV